EMRSTSVSVGTSSETTASSALPCLASASPSFSAWGMVLGNPSRMKPLAASGCISRSSTMLTTRSSGTSLPAAMMGPACFPSSVPSFTAWRRMSPVEACGTPIRAESRFACVPFPAPGGPSRTRFMTPPAERALRGRPEPTADPRAARPGEALVVAADEVPFDLLHGVQRHAHDDQQRGPAKLERQPAERRVGEDGGDDADEREVDRAAEGDAVQDAGDVLRRLPAWPDAR